MKNEVDRIAKFVRSHPGFYVSHDDRGVVAQVDCVDAEGEYREYATLTTMQAARDWLGY